MSNNNNKTNTTATTAIAQKTLWDEMLHIVVRNGHNNGTNNLYGTLVHLRDTGTMIQRLDDGRLALRPIIGVGNWPSQSAYDAWKSERLRPHHKELVKCLLELSAVELAGTVSDMYNRAVEDINKWYVPGTLDHTRDHHPELYESIQTSHKELETLWDDAMPATFRDALKKWYLLVVKSAGLYREDKISKALPGTFENITTPWEFLDKQPPQSVQTQQPQKAKQGGTTNNASQYNTAVQLLI